MPKGEARYLEYEKGMERPRSEPVEGDYQLTLKDMGKPGLKGWKKGKTPKKFPNRKVVFSILDTEDEVSGEEKTVRQFYSASPKAWGFVMDLAAAAGYPGKFKLEKPKSPKDTKAVHAIIAAIDKLLEYVKKNKVVLSAYLTIDEQGSKQYQSIGEWHPLGDEGGGSEDDESEESEDEESSDDETESEEESEETEDTESEEEADEETEDSEDEAEEEDGSEDEEEGEIVEEDEEVEEKKPTKKKGGKKKGKR